MSTAPSDPRILRGMETQLRLRQARLDAGAKPIGWKVGFGAPAAMERLTIDAPLIGFLTDQSILTSEATVSVAGWIKPVAEPEIAVYLGQDLYGALTRATAREAIASIGPAIELADISFPPDDVEAILAADIYHRHLVLGRSDASRAGGVLEGLEGRVDRDGTEIAATTDLQALTGDLVGIVQHVAELLAVFGERLRAGDVIIGGSIVPPIWIVGNEEIRYTLEPVDTISVDLEA